MWGLAVWVGPLYPQPHKVLSNSQVGLVELENYACVNSETDTMGETISGSEI